MRGCVSPKKAAASACVQPWVRMCSRKSISKSALIFKFAASSASKPTSLNTLSLPRAIFSTLALLGCFVTLLTDLDVSFGCFFGFLLERVEYVNRLLKYNNIEHTIGTMSINPNFVYAGTNPRHRLEVSWLPSPLHRRNSKPALRLASRGLDAHRHARNRSIQSLIIHLSTCQIRYHRADYYSQIGINKGTDGRHPR
jgi:hypothetical protein